ncbi:uncharacterized [Tachysurus ichikawai]
MSNERSNIGVAVTARLQKSSSTPDPEGGPQRVDPRGWTPEGGPQTVDPRRWTPDGGPQTVDPRRWTPDGGPQTVAPLAK